MRGKIRSILTIFIFALLIGALSVTAWTKPAESFSDSERRSLAKAPVFSINSLLIGKYMSDFESYSLDQFPMREGFKSAKAYLAIYLLGQEDNHGLYQINDMVSKLEYPMNEARLQSSAKKINEVNELYLKGKECKTYLAIIPDKNYYMASLKGYPQMDYELFKSKLLEECKVNNYIDIFPLLSLEDYYKTDQHWRQEQIIDVADYILDGMGLDTEKSSIDYTRNYLDIPFTGAYVGQLGIKHETETIAYLDNDMLNSCKVTNYNLGKPVASELYDFNRAMKNDPYDLFLSGATPLITIDNEAVKTDRELVIFRDSFASSMAPLLVPGYSRITLIDLRYIKSELIGQYIDFDKQDVLFLYSTLTLNNSISM